MTKKNELNLDELEYVTGGINPNRGCQYFLQAANKPNDRACKNCFYTNKIDGQYICTHSDNNKKINKNIM